MSLLLSSKDLTCEEAKRVSDYNWLGIVAAALGIIAIAPQVIRTAVTRETHGLAWSWMIIALAGAVAWLIYGIQTKTLPNIVSGIALTVAYGILIGFKAWLV